MPRLITGNLVALLCMVLWATSFPVTDLLLRDWHPMLLVPARLVPGTLAILLIVVFLLLEAEFMARYRRLERLASAEPEAVEVSDAPVDGGTGDDDACTLAGTAEHARADGGEACDDGRAG